ncbi:Uncharacterised protein [Mycobacterium tuberculosis]|nr:Uncharacterised protein [Mycobacterium tuberculosis]
MIPASQAATTQAPMRGATATNTPATISIAPTKYMHWSAVPGTRSLIQPTRYMFQCCGWVSRLKNLSSPNRMGATVNSVRSNTYAEYAGSFSWSARAGLVVGLMLIAASRLLTDNNLNVRSYRLYRQVFCLLEMAC